jgi:thioesterase domain-containing protein
VSPSDPILRETEAFFHAQIPITRAMGVQVAAYDGSEFVVTAPLGANHNHLGTAFGGSLAAVATLAAYGFLWLELGDRTVHLVIRDSALSYRRPVRREICAICRRPSDAEINAFKAAVAQKGKGRISLRVMIEEDNEVAVEFEGTFVAMK